ncbi:hypothetical protein RRG08_045235 [Elysia crispata]|uniref:Uncharacterized protein n=1 Tax=Elysia crispata TaxID=231223 RepID=A0AAE1DQT9_9GAST|nr:hypothetical protein RRG08_045235 [Elysia crispata]
MQRLAEADHHASRCGSVSVYVSTCRELGGRGSIAHELTQASEMGKSTHQIIIIDLSARALVLVSWRHHVVCWLYVRSLRVKRYRSRSVKHHLLS